MGFPNAVRRTPAVLTLLLAVVLTMAAACGGSPSQPSETSGPRETTVEYASGLTADVHLPAGADHAPLVVLVPGGAWQTAEPTGLGGLAEHLARAGIAAATVHIRAAVDGVGYPEPVEDVLCAVAAAAEEARSKGVVPDPIAVFGHSSGAHLAALAVLAAGDYAPSCGSAVVTPDALIGVSGPYDISRLPLVARALMRESPDDDPAAWASANPVERANLRPDVPVLLLHGATDRLVPVSFTTQFAAALEHAGHPTTVQVVPGADHLSIIRADVVGDRIAAWVQSLR